MIASVVAVVVVFFREMELELELKLQADRPRSRQRVNRQLTLQVPGIEILGLVGASH